MSKNSIFDLFPSSPLKPLKKLAYCITECSECLEPFFEACFANDWDKVLEVRQRIVMLEKKADNLKHEIRLKLPRGIFMPVDRADLLSLIITLDDVANGTRQISGLVIGRTLHIPEVLHEDFRSLVAKNLEATRQLKAILIFVDELLQFGFKGNKLKNLAKMILELEHFEHDVDVLQVNLRTMLFRVEQKMNPIDVMFLYSCIDKTSKISDKVQLVGSKIELMLAKA